MDTGEQELARTAIDALSKALEMQAELVERLLEQGRAPAASADGDLAALGGWTLELLGLEGEPVESAVPEARGRLVSALARKVQGDPLEGFVDALV